MLLLDAPKHVLVQGFSWASRVSNYVIMFVLVSEGPHTFNFEMHISIRVPDAASCNLYGRLRMYYPGRANTFISRCGI